MRANKIKMYLKKTKYRCSVAISRLRLVLLLTLPSCSSRILRALKQNRAQSRLFTRASVGKLEFKNASHSSSYLVAKCVVFAPKVPGVPSEDPRNWG